MPGPARRSGDGADAYAHSVARVACAQVVYAQAERLAEKGAKSVKSSGQNQTSTPRSGAKGRITGTGADSIAPSSVSMSESVADSLADIAAAFVTHLGRRASARAELGGRTFVTLTDVLACLQGMAPVTKSYAHDLARYLMLEEIPFPSEVPEFPLPVPLHGTHGGNQANGQASPLPPDPVDGSEDGVGTAHESTKGVAKRPWIEPWMPPLPPSRTYKRTPGVVAIGAANGRVGQDRALHAKSRRQVEQTLAKLKEGDFKSDGSATNCAPLSVDVSARGLVSASHALAQNPYLAPPKVGSAHMIDEDMTAIVAREPAEPIAAAGDTEGDSGMRDSNVSGPGGPSEGNDPRRARVFKIFTEARGSGSTANGGTASGATVPPPKSKPKGDDAMDVS